MKIFNIFKKKNNNAIIQINSQISKNKAILTQQMCMKKKK